MNAALILFALQSSGMTLPPGMGAGSIDGPDPGVNQALSGSGEWLNLPIEIAAEGRPSRTLAGDWNGDLRLDAAVLIEGKLFAVVAPGEERGGLRIGTQSDIADFDVLNQGGPDGQDALLTVSGSGLTKTYFDNLVGDYVEVSLEANNWLSATSVRVLQRPMLATPIYVGVAANGTSVLGFLPGQGLSNLLVEHTAPIVQLETLDWEGDAEEEFVVMSSFGAAVYDIRANLFDSWTLTGEESVSIAAFHRAQEAYARFAWVTRSMPSSDQGAKPTWLRAFADGLIEPVVDLGVLNVVGLTALELNGDGSDELFLSHQTSEHQVILNSQAVAGNFLSESFSSTEFEILTALPATSLWESNMNLKDALTGATSSSQSAGTSGSGAHILTNPKSSFGAAGGGGTPVPPGSGGTGSSSSLGARVGFTNKGPSALNLFARNRSTPAVGDFDGDGDMDLLFPVSKFGDLLFHRNGLIDHRTFQALVVSSSLNSDPSGSLRLELQVRMPDTIPNESTHLELAVWTADSLLDAVDNEVSAYKRITLTGSWPMTVDFLINEALPFNDVFHIQLRIVQTDGGPDFDLLEAYPVSTATYTSSVALFNSLLAASELRGGHATTPKAGPVFVGGIVPRPNLDPFAPGVMPIAPGGGQVQ